MIARAVLCAATVAAGALLAAQTTLTLGRA
jgi:hypothetical protein